MKAILFDIDGTLVKAGGSGCLALNKALEKLYGKKNICDGEFLAGSTDKDNFSRAYTVATGKKASAKAIALIQKTYLEILPGEVALAVKNKRYELINGISRLLATLSGRKDVMVGLGTGNVKEGALVKLAPSGLSEHFTFGGFGCDAFTRTEMLLTAVERASAMAGEKIPATRVFVIGDTQKDVSSAKEAGFHSAAITGGFGSEREIYSSCPELIQKDFSDIDIWHLWFGLTADPRGIERGCYICPDSPIEHVHFSRTGMDETQMRLLKQAKEKARKRNVR